MKKITLKLYIPIRDSKSLDKDWRYDADVEIIIKDNEEIGDIGNMDGFNFKVIKEEKL